MRNYLIFNGKDLRDFGVYISGQGTFSAPARSYNVVPIAGRNGDLVTSEKRLENLSVTYRAFIYASFDTNLRNLRNFLLSSVGYKQLSDSYHTDEYRMALYDDSFEPEVLSKNDAGEFNLTFNCKPQRWLTVGTTVTTLNASGSIINPTEFDSQPLLRVYGDGILGINSQSITISSSDVYTDIDCEMMDAYKGTANKNHTITLSDYNFPVFTAGTNSISLGTGITKVEITPRWWRV